VEIFANCRSGIALHQLELLDVRNGALLLVIVEQPRQILFVAGCDRVSPFFYEVRSAVLVARSDEPSESVKANDLASVIIRLVNAAKDFEQCEVLAPA